ncbi:hypothetical protein OOT55_11180 [Marinimicrobium sp. C6131]|uniref:hypothetical protein n=1 Tax=Marinimicrobium sp. C6131 TaxID=3022676 RepID=UPI00223E6CCC|nr:hypothetical protein [Marinimicrobium sp. C6131]UZJ43212.1 hypothetical protein OOT55_11180 [Marinimicrobium sp. C6131]
MKSVKIEVFEGEEREATITIPVAVLRVAAKLFPRKYLSPLENNDVSLSDILDAAASPEVDGRLIEFEDHRDNERVVISVC